MNYYLNLLKSKSKLFLQKKLRIPSKKPTEIHLSVTDNCCLRCKMCNIWKLKKRQPDLDLKTAKKIITRLTDWLGNYYLTFAGGEPFLNQDLIDIIRFASQQGAKTRLNSNGFVIDQKLAKKIATSGLNTISISIDGLKREHDYIRGKKGAFDQAVQAINWIKQAKTDDSTDIFINSVISTNNLNQLPKIFDLAQKLDLSGINFQALMPTFAAEYKSNWFKNNRLWPKNESAVTKSLSELIQLKKKYPKFIQNSITDLRKFKIYFSDPQLFQNNQPCFVGLNSLMIDTQGNCRLCYQMKKIGNIINKPPNLIWKNQKATQSRKKIAKCTRPCKMLPCNEL